MSLTVKGNWSMQLITELHIDAHIAVYICRLTAPPPITVGLCVSMKILTYIISYNKKKMYYKAKVCPVFNKHVHVHVHFPHPNLLLLN